MAKIINLYREDGKSFKENSAILQNLKKRDKLRADKFIAAYKQKLKNEVKETERR